jgi:hypothetical protein
VADAPFHLPRGAVLMAGTTAPVGNTPLAAGLRTRGALEARGPVAFLVGAALAGVAATAAAPARSLASTRRRLRVVCP